MSGLAEGGLILGHRIDRSSGSHPHASSAAAQARTLCAGGFGAYVALLRAPGGGAWSAFRDPSGALEALTWSWADIGVLSSTLEDVPAALRPGHMGLDWDAIAEFVLRPVAINAGVALAGLHALSPGEVRPLGGSAGEFVWRPSHWISDRPLDVEDPAEVLRETVRTTVAGLAAPYRRLVTELSGGFDSAVVNAALVEAGFTDRIVAALHYGGDRPEADERRWAEALAERFGLPLQVVVRPTQGAFDPEALAPLSRDARPAIAALDSERDADTAERLEALSADALVTGKGGDSNFFQMPAPTVLHDLWRARGAAAFVDPMGVAMARWLRRSMWTTWRQAFAPTGVWDGGGAWRFAGPALRAVPSGPGHPWLADLENVPAGKRVQVSALVGTQLAIGASRRSAVADLVQPLLAQPVMELCLALPSWRLVEGGRDRALARRAFGPWLPPTVAWRRSKGALTSIYARRLANGLDEVRFHLLEGVLVGSGILDRRAVEAALHPDALIRSRDGLDLVMACAVESWVRYWQTRIPDAQPRPRP